MEKEKNVVESIEEILPLTWEAPRSHLERDYGNLDKGTKLLVEFKNEVVKGEEKNAKEKLEEFLKMLEDPATLPIWKQRKEEFKQLLENFENYFGELRKFLEPKYEQYLAQKQKDEEKAKNIKGLLRR
jgi:hypothetical protein